MYKIFKNRKISDSEEEEIVELHPSWDDVLQSGLIGFLYVITGLLIVVAVPFLTIYAVFRQWKYGGIRCDGNHDVTIKTRNVRRHKTFDGPKDR